MGEQAPLVGPPASFRPLVLRTAVLLAVPGLLLMEAIIFTVGGADMNHVALFVAGAFGFVLSLIWACLMAPVCRVRVDKRGLCVGAFLGLGRSIPWAEVRDARPINFFGFRFLQVYAGERPAPAWMPLFLNRFDDFAETVFANAGPANPVSVGLAAYRGYRVAGPGPIPDCVLPGNSLYTDGPESISATKRSSSKGLRQSKAGRRGTLARSRRATASVSPGMRSERSSATNGSAGASAAARRHSGHRSRCSATAASAGRTPADADPAIS